MINEAAAMVTRILEEHSDLSGASVGKIIYGRGAGNGARAHRYDPTLLSPTHQHALPVLTVAAGPDHLSAIAAMTIGSSWKAFSLGVRWGCGHPRTAHHDILRSWPNRGPECRKGRLPELRCGRLHDCVGGLDGVNVRRKYLLEMAEKELEECPTSPSIAKKTDSRSPSVEFTAAGSHGHLAPISPAEMTYEVVRSPASSFHLLAHQTAVSMSSTRTDFQSSSPWTLGQESPAKPNSSAAAT
ncbi:unnamed protein product [Phytophthora lilii]|uniref:Unnamed protein product n=1 Tax=Phytophthora lilii TaxID=2077276 RepID=A0A9W7CML9_9STRA|nr:unnamed protein product [Phytophthora lilii]